MPVPRGMSNDYGPPVAEYRDVSIYFDGRRFVASPGDDREYKAESIGQMEERIDKSLAAQANAQVAEALDIEGYLITRKKVVGKPHDCRWVLSSPTRVVLKGIDRNSGSPKFYYVDGPDQGKRVKKDDAKLDYFWPAPEGLSEATLAVVAESIALGDQLNELSHRLTALRDIAYRHGHSAGNLSVEDMLLLVEKLKREIGKTVEGAVQYHLDREASDK